jgi:hypothetical protein
MTVANPVAKTFKITLTFFPDLVGVFEAPAIVLTP